MESVQPSRRSLLQWVAGVPALAAAAQPPGIATEARFPTKDGLGLPPGMIHLNTASAGPTPEHVLRRAVAAWREIETDPVRMSYAADSDSVVSAADRVRGRAAALVGCTADEVLLTRGTTDGITTLAHSIRLREGDRVLLTDQEHEGGETGWLHRARRDGVVVDRVPVPIGDWDMAAILGRFEAAIGPRTRAVCVSHVLSPTGLRMPIREIATLAYRKGALSIVDGAQAAGQIAVDVKALGCDAYATSGHKWLMAPKGTGFVYIAARAGEAIAPPQWLMGRNYGCNSAGLGPMPLAVGLGDAIDAMLRVGLPRVERYNGALAARIHAAFARMPELTLVSPSPGALSTALVAARLPAAIDSLALRQRLHDRHGVIIKMAEKRWFNGIRLSPHIFNDETEVDKALGALRSELAAMRSGGGRA